MAGRPNGRPAGLSEGSPYIVNTSESWIRQAKLVTSLHHKVRRTILRYELCPPGSRVLVALSGGSDSVALTLLLCDLAEDVGFSVVALAHLNHQIRPAGGDDVQFCRGMAARIGLPIVTESTDVRAYARERRLSLEDAARRLRYDFLARASTLSGADRVAVGHTVDDQAETFLLKLIRGAGLTGLSSIHPRRGIVIRPLLEVGRVELQDFLRAQNHAWVEDDTNADLENPRNRIRHRVLPELDRVYPGPTRATIARAAALLREDGQWLDEVGTRRFHDLAIRVSDGLEFEVRALTAEPLPIRRRVILQALRTLAGQREVGSSHVEVAMAVLSGSCRATETPGARVQLRAGRLVLMRQGGAAR
jgi:tRNA(Ile)-lysidine synthase